MTYLIMLTNNDTSKEFLYKDFHLQYFTEYLSYATEFDTLEEANNIYHVYFHRLGDQYSVITYDEAVVINTMDK